MPNPTAETPPPYDPQAIFRQNGPFHPGCVAEAVTTIMRNTPIDPNEPAPLTSRRFQTVLRSLAALHPRDEIELMLGVQAVSAYYAACACWRLGMNIRQPNGDSTRHIATANSAARTFDAMLRAIERRQAKPLSVPIGRPAPQVWPDTETNGHLWSSHEDHPIPAGPAAPWIDDDHATDDEILDRACFSDENEGLDIANTEGILPGGGMIMPEYPTPHQIAYVSRRIVLMHRRERDENRRIGIMTKTHFRPTRTGDLIP
jgi:hypothetical protein